MIQEHRVEELQAYLRAELDHFADTSTMTDLADGWNRGRVASYLGERLAESPFLAAAPPDDAYVTRTTAPTDRMYQAAENVAKRLSVESTHHYIMPEEARMIVDAAFAFTEAPPDAAVTLCRSIVSLLVAKADVHMAEAEQLETQDNHELATAYSIAAKVYCELADILRVATGGAS